MTAIACWGWRVLTIAALIWYSTVTIYVAVRGVRDIRTMLQRLAQRRGPSLSERE